MLGDNQYFERERERERERESDEFKWQNHFVNNWMVTYIIIWLQHIHCVYAALTSCYFINSSISVLFITGVQTTKHTHTHMQAHEHNSLIPRLLVKLVVPDHVERMDQPYQTSQLGREPWRVIINIHDVGSESHYCNDIHVTHSLPLAIITFVAIREKKTDMIGTLLLTWLEHY